MAYIYMHGQCFHRNCILVHGIKEIDDGGINVVVAETMIEHLQERLTDDDLVWSHLIGKPKKGK